MANVPHSRLKTETINVSAERLKGRLSNKLAERIQGDFKLKKFDKRYHQQRKFLSLDTPENRFIKMVVNNTKSQIGQLSAKLALANAKKEIPRLSTAFFDELKSWQLPLIKMSKQSFLKEGGEHRGLKSESLVLQ